MKVIRILVFCTLVMSSAGCNDLYDLKEEPIHLSVTIKNATPNILIDAEGVIVDRLERMAPSIFSVVESKVYKDEIFVTLKNGAPPKRVIQDLITHVGELSIHTGHDGKSLVINEHIKSVAIKYDQIIGMHTLKLNFNSLVMLDISKRNIGRLLTIKLDNEILYSSRVKGVIGEYMQVAIGSKEDCKVVSAILSSGQLPKKVTLVSHLDDDEQKSHTDSN